MEGVVLHFLWKEARCSHSRGGGMLPLFLSVPCSWLMLAPFYLLVYRHSARLSSVAGSCTNLRCTAGRWEQLSWDCRHLHPPSTHQNYTEQTEGKSFMVRSTEALKETDNMTTAGSQLITTVFLQLYLGFILLLAGSMTCDFKVFSKAKKSCMQTIKEINIQRLL